MPTVSESQQAIATARQALRDQHDLIRTKDYEIARKRAEIETLLRESEDPPTQQQGELNDLLSQREGLMIPLPGLRTGAHSALETFIGGFTNPHDLFNTTIEPNRSIAMFPVRLETYFKRPANPADAVQLLVRVYPDDIHLEAHEPALTDAEITASEAFWTVAGDFETLQSPTPDNESILRQAWAQLIADVGGHERASYIVSATEPNPPSPPPTPPRRSPEWRRRPEARTLPDRWLVLGFPEGVDVPNAFLPTYGSAIPDPLPVAPLAPLEEVPAAATASQLFDDETRWLVNFDDAERVGMGIRVTLPIPAPAKIGVLMVLGIKASLQSGDGLADPTRDTALRRFGELFESHRYTKGLALLPDGTPTNGGEADRSGFTERPPADATFDIEFRANRDPAERTNFDGQPRLNNEELAHLAFGFGVDSGTRPFHNVEHGERLDDLHARALNFVMWRSTWGYHLDQMINEIVQFRDNENKWDGRTVQNYFGEGGASVPRINYARNIYARWHFSNYVRSGSSIPALRVGSQPYGLLPVTSWDEWGASGYELPSGPTFDQSREFWFKFPTEAFWPKRTWDIAIVDFLRKLRTRYFRPGTANVTTVANSFAQQHDAIIKLMAWSESNRRLRVTQWESLQHRPVWEWPDEFAPPEAGQAVAMHRAESERALVALEFLHVPPAAGDWRPRARDIIDISNGTFDTGVLPPVFVSAPIIHDGPLSQTKTLAQSLQGVPPGPIPHPDDYLFWLGDYAHRTWMDIDQEVGSPFAGRGSDVPLLYSMLRHAYLSELAWHPMAYGGYFAFADFFRSVEDYPLDAPFRLRHFFQRPMVFSDMGDFRGATPADRSVTPSYLSLLYAATEPKLIELPVGNRPPRVGDYLEKIRNSVVVEGNSQDAAATTNLYASESDSSDVKHRLHPSFFHFYQYLETLKEQPTAVLERNTRGVIDLASHRLDAWFTSYAHRRHWESRIALVFSGQSIAPHIGGYGWVENLRMRPDVTDPTQGTPRSLGHAFAPSPAQATAAAIMRAAQIAHSRDAATQNLLGVNLSSARVREAKDLIDSVRQGQPLGAVLGYRFERGLHETSQQPGALQLDQFILPFRKLCPLVADQLPQQPDPTLDTAIEKIAASNVVDGLALARKAREVGIPWGTVGLPALGSAPQLALAAAIARLERSVDSVADAVLAESVYQGVLGNPSRQGGLFGALNRGENAIPEFGVLETPRSGDAYTHRLLVAVQSPTPPLGWAETPRRFAEPRLNTWLGSLLPAPATVFARVEFLDPATGQPGTTPTRFVHLGELGVAPIDVVYDAITGLKPAETILGQRVLTLIDDQGLGLGEDAVLTFDLSALATPPQFAADFESLITLADMLRKLIVAGRPLRVAETSLANDAASDPPPTGAPDLIELSGRVSSPPSGGALERLTAIATTLATPTSTVAELRTALQGAANFGITSALPGLLLRPTGLTDALSPEYAAAREAATRELAAAVLPEAQRRLAALAALDDAFNSPDTEDIQVHHLARLEALFGAGFRAVVKLKPNNIEEFPLAASAATSLRLQRNDPRQVVTWLQRTSRTRKSIETFADAMLFVEALRQSDPLDLRVAQIPFVPPPSGNAESWIGLAFAGAERPEGDRLGLVLQNASALNPAEDFAGLVIDEWVEMIPAEKTTAALTFHYDTPGSRPGNAVLFVTPPTPNSAQTGYLPINLTSLYKAVLGTLDLARMRMVDLPSLGDEGASHLAPYLPATLHTTDTNVREIDTPFIRNTQEAGEP